MEMRRGPVLCVCVRARACLIFVCVYVCVRMSYFECVCVCVSYFCVCVCVQVHPLYCSLTACLTFSFSTNWVFLSPLTQQLTGKFRILVLLVSLSNYYYKSYILYRIYNIINLDLQITDCQIFILCLFVLFFLNTFDVFAEVFFLVLIRLIQVILKIYHLYQINFDKTYDKHF